MKLVIVESPYRGATTDEQQRNVIYARRAIKDCLERGESPLASHLLYTQVLNDGMLMDRKLGIEAGLAWLAAADYQVIYTDYGISEGMKSATEAGEKLGKQIFYRFIGKNP